MGKGQNRLKETGATLRRVFSAGILASFGLLVGSDGDTDAYLDHVCHFCCASPDNPYTLTPSRLMALVSAIIKHENGTNPYSPQIVQEGVDSAYR